MEARFKKNQEKRLTVAIRNSRKVKPKRQENQVIENSRKIQLQKFFHLRYFLSFNKKKLDLQKQCLSCKLGDTKLPYSRLPKFL